MGDSETMLVPQPQLEPPGASLTELPTAPPPRAIEEAFLAITARGIAGLVWLNESLVVSRTMGPLAGFVRLNREVSQSVLPLAGADAEIAELAFAPGGQLHLPAVTIQTADGPTPRLDLYLFPLAQSHDGNPGYLLVLQRAIEAADSAPELARQMRARLIAESELARAKRNLEEFAGILAHDMGAPMRAMRHLAGDLAHQLEGSSDAATIALIAGLEAQSRRLSQMMTALLDYASAGRLADAVASVDTGALVRAVAAGNPRPPGMRIEIEGDWPVIDTLAAPLDLVLRNLLDNAVKHHDRAFGEVRIKAEPRETALVITVSDDGPGIGPPEHAAIFLPFRTLAPQGASAANANPAAAGGTGMGLAFVRRAIEAVGGSLSIASDPSQSRGTTFYLAWPLRIQGHRPSSPPENPGDF